MAILYDPTGILPGNNIVNELHDLITGPKLTFEHSPFYASGLTVRGKKKTGPAISTLKLYVDYIYSPLFIRASENTGKEVYSYILLTDYEKWDDIILQYHAVGGDPDQALLAKIIAAGDFDTSDINAWIAFDVAMDPYPAAYKDFNLKNLDINFLFANRLAGVAKALSTPGSYVDFINTDFAELVQLVGALQLQMASLQQSIALNGTITGDAVSETFMINAINAALAELGTASTKDINFFAVKNAETVTEAISTVVGLIKRNANGTYSAASAGTDYQLPLKVHAKGTLNAPATVTFNLADGGIQTLTCGGTHALTWEFTGWPATGYRGSFEVQAIDMGLGTLAFTNPVTWKLKDDTYTTDFAAYLLDRGGELALKSNGTHDTFIFWSNNAGTTLYGKLV